MYVDKSQKDAEEAFTCVSAGDYLRIHRLTEYGNPRETIHELKILNVKPTRNFFLFALYGNITIQFPDGNVCDLYYPEPEKKVMGYHTTQYRKCSEAYAAAEEKYFSGMKEKAIKHTYEIVRKYGSGIEYKVMPSLELNLYGNI